MLNETKIPKAEITSTVTTRYKVPYVGGPSDGKFWDGLNYHYAPPTERAYVYDIVEAKTFNYVLQTGVGGDHISMTTRCGVYELKKEPSLHYAWKGWK